jgi:hypothetical protein
VLTLLDRYLGDYIENVVYKYGYNVDLDDEYEALLKYIYRKLVRAWFKGREPSPSELESTLRSVLRKRRQLEIVLSYLVSRFAARTGSIYIRNRSDWHDERSF